MSDIQKLFNIAVTGVLKQGAPSMLNYTCAYRGNGGRRCAVGFLIDDEHYDEALEGESVYDPRVIEAIQQSHPDLAWTGRVRNVLSALQSSHDGLGDQPPGAFTTRFRMEAEMLAREYQLEMPDV